jgi:predicted PolB exonuclease-like 3'-5' exonuclease
MEKRLKHILFLDLETVSAFDRFDKLDERLQKEWIRKAKFIKTENNPEPDFLYKERAAIYAEFGKIVCIGLGFLYQRDEKVVLRLGSIHGDDEKQLLEDFSRLINEKFDPKKLSLCAHNGFEFDFPYLCRRMRIHGLTLPKPLEILVAAKPWENPHIDTMELWKFGDRKHYTSLDLLASIFEIGSSKSDIDGSMVSKVYHEDKNLDRIVKYCIKDVEVLSRVYLKLIGSELQIDEIDGVD